MLQTDGCAIAKRSHVRVKTISPKTISAKMLNKRSNNIQHGNT